MFAAGPQAGAAEMFHSIGVAIVREGSPDIAALFLRLGMYLDPNADVIDVAFGQLLDEAGKVLDKVGEGGLEDFLVFHRALMADVAGRTADALTFAARARESDPYVARIVEAYLRMLGNAGRFDEAEDVLADFDSQGLSHPLVDALRAPDEVRLGTEVSSGMSRMATP